MVRENKKTVLRTIRLSKGLDELLQKDANLSSLIEPDYHIIPHHSTSFDRISTGWEN
jgi:hypothetical protein